MSARLGPTTCVLWILIACAIAAGPVRAQEPPGPVLAIVRVPTPWWAPDFLVDLQFARSIPRYAAIPGLLRKHYLRTDARALGGLYLWQTRDHAERFYDAAWRRDLTERYGEAPRLSLFTLAESPALPTTDTEGQSGLEWAGVLTSSDGGGECAADQARAIETLVPTSGLRRLLLFDDRVSAEAFLAGCDARRPNTDLDDEILSLPVHFDNRR